MFVYNFIITICILFSFVLLQGPPGKGTLISVGAPCSNEMKEMNIRKSNIYRFLESSEVLLQGAGNKESERLKALAKSHKEGSTSH